MKPIASISASIATVALAFTLTGCATSATDQHKAHHPENGSASQSKMGMMSGSMPMTGMDTNMMGMCKNMMSAKTPDERKAMMDEHMKSMSPEMRQQCMQMMQMQMGNQVPAK